MIAAKFGWEANPDNGGKWSALNSLLFAINVSAPNRLTAKAMQLTIETTCQLSSCPSFGSSDSS